MILILSTVNQAITRIFIDSTRSDYCSLVSVVVVACQVERPRFRSQKQRPRDTKAEVSPSLGSSYELILRCLHNTHSSRHARLLRKPLRLRHRARSLDFDPAGHTNGTAAYSSHSFVSLRHLCRYSYSSPHLASNQHLDIPLVKLCHRTALLHPAGRLCSPRRRRACDLLAVSALAIESPASGTR